MSITSSIPLAAGEAEMLELLEASVQQPADYTESLSHILCLHTANVQQQIHAEGF